MKKLLLALVMLVLVGSLAFGEEVLYKFSAGPSAGLVKTGGVFDYWALGQTYGGVFKFGITKEFEIGIQGAYNYSYPGNNISIFPFPLRDAETKVLLPLTDFHPPGNAFVVIPDSTNINGYRLESYKKIRFSMDRHPNLPIKLTAIPIELFMQWRSFTHTIFNPYIQIGGGLMSWKAVNDETGKLFEVAYEPDARYGDVLPETTWVEFKGRHFHMMLGLGFEVFPVEQVGIDVGFRGYYPFMDDMAVFTLDTIVGWAEISARLNFYYGGVRDSDKDGVFDKDDKCPHTPFGAIVDEFGCPVDTDGDGIFDGLDKCPNTAIGCIVDIEGCPLDIDGDAICDGIDRCPETPSGVKVDEFGCPVDSDGDGVPDYLDNCPNTPLGALVDVSGCPMDTDGDGVYDGLDKCPNTPIGTVVNQFGCPQTKADTDGDGISDDQDRCPDTPRGARVDDFGCPVDSDSDMVPDHKDKCPNTTKGCIVDADGCPLDSDGDGVCDGLDKCPNTPKDIEVNEDGCPKLKKLKKGESIRVKVYFETAKWDITPQGAKDLQIAFNTLKAYPEMMVVIEGHTDARGAEDYNRELSIKRAKSIKEWLVKQGIEDSRLETVGYGESRPVDTNETAEGMANNRRIEFRCTSGCAEEVEFE